MKGIYPIVIYSEVAQNVDIFRIFGMQSTYSTVIWNMHIKWSQVA